jgi:hypothetical protein
MIYIKMRACRVSNRLSSKTSSLMIYKLDLFNNSVSYCRTKVLTSLAKCYAFCGFKRNLAKPCLAVENQRKCAPIRSVEMSPHKSR